MSKTLYRESEEQSKRKAVMVKLGAEMMHLFVATAQN